MVGQDAIWKEHVCAQQRPESFMELDGLEEAPPVNVFVASMHLDDNVKKATSDPSSSQESECRMIFKFILSHSPSISFLDMRSSPSQTSLQYIVGYFNSSGFYVHHFSVKPHELGSSIASEKKMLLIVPLEPEAIDQHNSNFKKPEFIKDFERMFQESHGAHRPPERLLLHLENPSQKRLYDFFLKRFVEFKSKEELKKVLTSRKRKSPGEDEPSVSETWEANHYDAFTKAGLEWPPPLENVDGYENTLSKKILQAMYYYQHIPRSTEDEITFHDLSKNLMSGSWAVGTLPTIGPSSIIFMNDGPRSRLLLTQELMILQGYIYEVLFDADGDSPGFSSQNKRLMEICASTINSYGMAAVFFCMLRAGIPLGEIDGVTESDADSGKDIA